MMEMYLLLYRLLERVGLRGLEDPAEFLIEEGEVKCSLLQR